MDPLQWIKIVPNDSIQYKDINEIKETIESEEPLLFYLGEITT